MYQIYINRGPVDVPTLQMLNPYIVKNNDGERVIYQTDSLEELQKEVKKIKEDDLYPNIDKQIICVKMLEIEEKITIIDEA